MGVRRANKSSEAGLSLVEVLVATAILVVGGLGLFFMSSSTIHGNTLSADQAAAAALAIAKIEELKNADFDSVIAGGPDNLDASGAAGNSFTRQWTVTYPQWVNGSAAKDITVTVGWTGGGSTSISSRIVQVDEESPGMPKAFLRCWDQQ